MLSRIVIVVLVGALSSVSFGRTFIPACINTYISSGKYGERYFLDSTNANSGIKNPDQLKIVSQNFENLGQFKEFSRIKQLVNGVLTQVKVEKTIERSYGQNLRMAARLKAQDPDIIIGMEVKDIESGQKFAQEFLDDKYQAILIEGNDQRGIDVCFFVKRTLNLDFEVESHKKYSLTNDPNDPVFSRDLPVLYVRQAGASKSSQPLMAVFASHLKSQLGANKKNGIDKTAIKRTEQVEASLQIMTEIKKKYPGIPMVMGGDFNNDVRMAREFEGLYAWGLADALDFDRNPIPKAARNTHYFFKLDGETPDPSDSVLVSSQIDGMFVNSEFSKYILQAGIQRDLRPDGTPAGIPKDADAVNKRASDHDGLFLVIDFAKMVLGLKQ